MIVLPERDEAFVVEASMDWEAAGVSPVLLLDIGGEDYSDAVPSGDWSQEGIAITMEGDLLGNLPLRLYGAPMKLLVDIGGRIVPALNGVVGLAEPNDDGVSTKLTGASAGSLASVYPLNERVEYPGLPAEEIARDALRRLPYVPGGIRVEPHGGRLTFAVGSEEGPFEAEQYVSDILSKVEERTGYVFRDDAHGGHRAVLATGAPALFGVPEHMRFSADELLSWKEPALAQIQYAGVVVFKRLPDGSDAFPPVFANVVYHGNDYAPQAGAILPVPWSGDEAGAQKHAYERARELGRGLYANEPVLPYRPLLESLDGFLVASVVEEDGGFVEREWFHRADSFEQAWSEGFHTAPTCSVLLVNEQRVKAPTLVLSASAGVLTTPGSAIEPAYGVEGDDLYFDEGLGWVRVEGDDLVFYEGAPVSVEGDDLVVTK